MCNAAAGARAPVDARDQVLGLLRQDFHRVLDEFREFNRLAEEDADAGQERQRVVQRTFAELKVIAAVEEQVLYPAVRDALQGTDLIDQSEIEHACIRRLVDELESAAPDRADYPKDFRILGEHVRLHVKDEELELFPALREADADWDRLCTDVRSCRAELAEDLGIPQLAQTGDESESQHGLALDAGSLADGEVIDETAEA
jgi:catechol 2,3-dioxygenase-like lactoylglutathione lyase family enzyme